MKDRFAKLAALVRSADARRPARLTEKDIEKIATAIDRIEALPQGNVRGATTRVIDHWIGTLLREPEFVLGRKQGSFLAGTAFRNLRADAHDIDGFIAEYSAQSFCKAAENGDVSSILELKEDGFDINAHAENRHRAPLAHLANLSTLTPEGQVKAVHLQILIDHGATVSRTMLKKVRKPALRAALEAAWLRQETGKTEAASGVRPARIARGRV